MVQFSSGDGLDPRLEVTLPRREVSVREAVRKLSLASDKAQGTLPLNVSQKKLALEKLVQELAKARERHGKLKYDRGLMTITAPADNQTYNLGQAVSTTFSCTEATGGPGIQTCVDSNGATGGNAVKTR